MADFNFFLNRQGVRGNKGEQGEQGYSPRITVKTETASEYILNVQNEDGSFDTPNLRGNAIENLGGTYVRFNQDTEQMYTGYADTASTTSQGEVILSTYDDLVSGGDENEVTTSKDVHDFVEAKISEASVNYVDIDDYTQKMGELDSEISDLDNNKLDFNRLANILAAGTNITITPNTSTGKITIAGEPVSQAQADWNQTDTNAPDYIKNKPTIPEAVTIDSELSSTSTNPVQNRLITNAINLISNEFENYATNKLDNLSNEGEARLHALKAYSDNGEVLTDAKGLSNIAKYAHSTFDRSKFTVVGSPNITDDGYLSNCGSGKYLKTGISIGQHTFKVWSRFKIMMAEQTIIGCVGEGYGAFLKQLSSGRVGSSGLKLSDNTGLSMYVDCSSYSGQYVKVLQEFDGSQYKVTAYNDSNEIIDSKSYTSSLYIASINGEVRLGVLADNTPTVPTNTGSIDLKQFSITVEGVEVFSGNKTGIDVIKPDDYTVVGTPTISDDGIYSNPSDSNYVKTPTINFSGANTWDITVCAKRTSDDNTQTARRILTFNNAGYLIWNTNYLEWFYSRGGTYSIYKNTSYVTQLNKYYWLRIGFDGTNYSLKISEDGQNYTTLGSIDASTISTPMTDQVIFLGMSNVTANREFLGDIDLNSFKIYVDGNLVYQPCLKIPYTLSKTGSKIVNAIYRDRVNDMASQFGYANYYTLDEDSGNFTLPQVELSGLIEKAASTIPSGVVQSSTIKNIVSLTQAEYDALTTKDSNTFYVITPST